MAHVYPALVGIALDDDVVSRSVRIGKASGPTSFADVMMALSKAGVNSDDVETVARGPPGSRGLELTFTSPDVLETFCSGGPIEYRGVRFDVSRYDKQIVEARIHWLPVHVKDHVISKIFSSFGRIISITGESTKYGQTTIKTGVRVVKIEIDEVAKSTIPHLLQFACGRKALVTVRGRPPLCLKCHRVGHMGSGCPGTVTNAGTVFQEREVEKTAVDEVREEATEEVEEREMETVHEETEEVTEEKTEEETEEKKEKIEEEDVVEEDNEMNVEVRGEKRSSSAESGWTQIPPNKRKSGSSSGAGGAARVSVLTQELEAVLAEDPLTPVGGLSSAADDSVLEGLLAMQSPHA